MKDYAKAFYKSPAWQNARKSYMKSVGGLCERCRKAGIYKAGEIVHHKIHITPDNIDDPDITLNWDNLELLCRECHYLMPTIPRDVILWMHPAKCSHSNEREDQNRAFQKHADNGSGFCGYIPRSIAQTVF